jgi:hypothetical protein
MFELVPSFLKYYRTSPEIFPRRYCVYSELMIPVSNPNRMWENLPKLASRMLLDLPGEFCSTYLEPV